MSISNELIDQLLDGAKDPEDLLGKEGLLQELTKRLTERALQAEMEQHVGYAKNDVAGNNSGNSRNGATNKSVRSVHGDIDLDIPRDRNGTFEPQLVKKGERQLGGFDERIISRLWPEE
ncbi:putative transposase for insertion sequence element ISRM3-like [Nymphon striatum]|nr:putative transposase for insertion sequence element ISRM3-like [Nymphon striatum]